MEVLPRKYRFRILAASMSRFWQLAIADPNGNAVPFQFIGNDGNLVVNPIPLTTLDQQGTAERYDIVVDFSKFSIGSRLTLVNTLQQTDGRKPDNQLPLRQALAGDNNDPAVGGILQFRVVGSAASTCRASRCSPPVPTRAWPAVLTQRVRSSPRCTSASSSGAVRATATRAARTTSTPRLPDAAQFP